MDFSFSPDQEELRDLARRIITDRCTPEHLRAISDTVSGTDLELWRSLAAAGIVGDARVAKRRDKKAGCSFRTGRGRKFSAHRNAARIRLAISIGMPAH